MTKKFLALLLSLTMAFHVPCTAAFAEENASEEAVWNYSVEEQTVYDSNGIKITTGEAFITDTYYYVRMAFENQTDYQDLFLNGCWILVDGIAVDGDFGAVVNSDGDLVGSLSFDKTIMDHVGMKNFHTIEVIFDILNDGNAILRNESFKIETTCPDALISTPDLSGQTVFSEAGITLTYCGSKYFEDGDYSNTALAFCIENTVDTDIWVDNYEPLVDGVSVYLSPIGPCPASGSIILYLRVYDDDLADAGVETFDSIEMKFQASVWGGGINILVPTGEFVELPISDKQ